LTSPFKGLKDKLVEIKVGGEAIKIKPTVADAELFMTIRREPSSEDAKKITKILVDMIARANPDQDKADIEEFVARHYGELIMKAAVVYGFATEDKIEGFKKKLMQSV